MLSRIILKSVTSQRQEELKKTGGGEEIMTADQGGTPGLT